ncbi:MAG: hypothetical protein JWR07_81 [Nevskia sp.]|nr:hypothetical protein [Nevskia sp.]
MVRETLKQSGLAPEHLELEITEGMLMCNPKSGLPLYAFRR